MPTARWRRIGEGLDLNTAQAQAVAALRAEYGVVSQLFLTADMMLRRIDAEEGTASWPDLHARQWRESLERLHAIAGYPRTPQ
jgi:hypothetical protein